MFKMFESLARAAVGVITLPAAVVADVATRGGTLTDRERPYTEEVIENVMHNWADAMRPK